MPTSPQLFEQAVEQIRGALAQPERPDWGWQLRGHLRQLRVAIIHEPQISEAWLAARCTQAHDERAALMARIARLSPIVLAGEAIDDVRMTVERLLQDAEHYRQRVHDLVYDAVSFEVGGSE